MAACMTCSSTFLSTFPLRGTSSHYWCLERTHRHFYPRSPCGERLLLCLVSPPQSTISIHVPLAGNVSTTTVHTPTPMSFLSTFPLRGTSRRHKWPLNMGIISIHVPLAGNVRHASTRIDVSRYFYPRSPCGERLGFWGAPLRHTPFLSTFPLRGTSTRS